MRKDRTLNKFLMLIIYFGKIKLVYAQIVMFPRRWLAVSVLTRQKPALRYNHTLLDLHWIHLGQESEDTS